MLALEIGQKQERVRNFIKGELGRGLEEEDEDVDEDEDKVVQGCKVEVKSIIRLCKVKKRSIPKIYKTTQIFLNIANPQLL